MFIGLCAGIFWALETLTLGIAMAMTPFVSSTQALLLAPFVSTFLHDACSALWAGCHNGFHGELANVYRALRTKNGQLVMLGAVIGGPIGMTGYVLAIHSMGASIGAVASAIFPAIGAVLAHIFLKEQIQWYRWIFLCLTLLGVYGLSWSPELNLQNFWLGLLGAAMCAFGWGIEAVILAHAMQDDGVKDSYALQIRQTTSALIYGFVILPLLNGWKFTTHLLFQPSGWLLPVLAMAALFATISYLCYYRAIATIGPSKAMALNITYAGWSILFTVLILQDTNVLTPLTILCTGLVLICGILAATDFRELTAQRPQ